MASKVLNLTNEEVLQRAREAMKFSNDHAVKYHLEYPNGGSNPEAKIPFDVLNIQGQNFYVADCIGFALWATGISRRFQGEAAIPPFPDTPNIGGGYINTTSIVQEAQGFPRRAGQAPYVGGRFFKVVTIPQPGDLIVFSGRTKQFPNNPKKGHIGVISSVPAEAPEHPELVDNWISYDTRNHRAPLQIIHCTAAGGKADVHAVKETHARPWHKNGSLFVRLNREELFGRPVA